MAGTAFTHPNGSRTGSHGVPAGVLLVTAIPVAVLFFAPLAGALGWVEAEAACRVAFHGICHQRPDRSFAVYGAPLAACARCTGIWCGLLAGVAAASLIPRLQRLGGDPPRALLCLLLGVAGAQPLLAYAGLAPDTAALRAATAFPAAAACGVLLLATAVHLFEPRPVLPRVSVTGAPHAEA